MSNRTYDQKNKEDFEANTLSLNNALREIESNKKLKATVAQLSKMTGIHRNTISNRVEPVQKLKLIKEKRIAELKAHNNQNSSSIKKSIEEKLNQSQSEIIYWFNEYQDMKRFFEHSKKRFEEMRKSRDHYKMLYKIERESHSNTEQEFEKLKESLKLESISSEQFRH